MSQILVRARKVRKPHSNDDKITGKCRANWCHSIDWKRIWSKALKTFILKGKWRWRLKTWRWRIRRPKCSAEPYHLPRWKDRPSALSVGLVCGKSSLVNMIPRFYDATQGNVEVFGEDVRRYRFCIASWAVGMVLQKAQLFRGTIADNVRLETYLLQGSDRTCTRCRSS